MNAATIRGTPRHRRRHRVAAGALTLLAPAAHAGGRPVRPQRLRQKPGGDRLRLRDGGSDLGRARRLPQPLGPGSRRHRAGRRRVRDRRRPRRPTVSPGEAFSIDTHGELCGHIIERNTDPERLLRRQGGRLLRRPQEGARQQRDDRLHQELPGRPRLRGAFRPLVSSTGRACPNHRAARPLRGRTSLRRQRVSARAFEKRGTPSPDLGFGDGAPRQRRDRSPFASETTPLEFRVVVTSAASYRLAQVKWQTDPPHPHGGMPPPLRQRPVLGRVAGRPQLTGSHPVRATPRPAPGGRWRFCAMSVHCRGCPSSGPGGLQPRRHGADGQLRRRRDPHTRAARDAPRGWQLTNACPIRRSLDDKDACRPPAQPPLQTFRSDG